MKLQDLEVIITAPPAPGWGGRYWIFVKVTTDTGVTRHRGMLCQQPWAVHNGPCDPRCF